MGKKKTEKPTHCIVCGREGVHCRSMCHPCYDKSRGTSRYGKDRVKRMERTREWRARNPEKILEQRKAYRDKYPDWKRWAYLNLTYGISQADFEAILDVQGGGCAICRKVPDGKPLHVDHDHETGAVRGLLCRNCNIGLGNFFDDRENIRRALDYLTRNQKIEE